MCAKYIPLPLNNNSTFKIFLIFNFFIGFWEQEVANARRHCGKIVWESYMQFPVAVTFQRDAMADDSETSYTNDNDSLSYDGFAKKQ